MCVAGGSQASQAVSQRGIFIDKVAQVEFAFKTVKAARLQDQLSEGYVQRALGHKIDNAAGAALPIEHGGGAAQNLNPLCQVGFGIEAGKTGGINLQTVAEDWTGEPANIDECIKPAIFQPESFPLDARRIAQGFAEGVRFL